MGAGRHEVVLLQARPITALPVQPVPNPVAGTARIWDQGDQPCPTSVSPFSEGPSSRGSTGGAADVRRVRVAVRWVQARNIGGWFYVGIVPLGGKEPPRLPGWLIPVTFKLVPPLRRRIGDSVAAMRADVRGALLQRWSREWRPDFVARVRAHRERQLPNCQMPTSTHTWPM